jgi:hypothetical protein
VDKIKDAAKDHVAKAVGDLVDSVYEAYGSLGPSVFEDEVGKIYLTPADGARVQELHQARDRRRAIQAGDNSEIAHLKQGVGAVLAEHRALTDEYKRLKAQRPDWKTPERSG